MLAFNSMKVMLNIELSKRQANEVIDMKFLTELKWALIFYVILSSSFTASSMFYSAIVQVCLAYNEICHKKPQKSLLQWKADNFNLPNKARLNGNKSILFRKSVKNELNRVLKAKKIFPAPEHQHIGRYFVRQH